MYRDRENLKIAGVIFGIIVFCGGAWHLFNNTKSCIETCRYTTRNYVPAHDNIWYSMECVWHDAKTGACTIQIPQKHVDHIPDAWYLTWQDFKGSQHTNAVTREYFENHPDSETHTHMRWKVCVQ